VLAMETASESAVCLRYLNMPWLVFVVSIMW